MFILKCCLVAAFLVAAFALPSPCQISKVATIVGTPAPNYLPQPKQLTLRDEAARLGPAVRVVLVQPLAAEAKGDDLNRVLYWTEKDAQATPIISARYATKKEERAYVQEITNREDYP